MRCRQFQCEQKSQEDYQIPDNKLLHVEMVTIQLTADDLIMTAILTNLWNIGHDANEASNRCNAQET